MSSRVHCYIRTERRKWALTQEELVFLLGRKKPSYVSRLEQCERKPGMEVMLACEMIFGLSLRALFPKLYRDIEEAVLIRAAKLYEKLEPETDEDSMRKKEFLSALLKRAITRTNKTEGE